MRQSSNPAFRNLPSGQGGGYATFNPQSNSAGGVTSVPEHAHRLAGPGERPITVDDIVMKTGMTAGTALAAGTLVALTPTIWPLAIPAFIVGIVLSFALIFKPQWAKAPLVLLYSASMGVALGAISGAFSREFEGIALQAVVGTAGVFIGMLVVYKTGAVRVTPRFTKWIMGAMVGIVVLIIFNLVASLFFGFNTGLRDGSPLAIIFSLVIIGVAAFSLLLDFEMADQAVRAGAPEKMSWYIAFGLMTTLVWLYIEILRLLSYLRGE